MFVIYFLFTLMLLVGFIAYVPWDEVMTRVVATSTPTVLGTAWVDFITGIHNWGLLLIVILPALLWVFVNSRKPQTLIGRRRPQRRRKR